MNIGKFYNAPNPAVLTQNHAVLKACYLIHPIKHVQGNGKAWKGKAWQGMVRRGGINLFVTSTCSPLNMYKVMGRHGKAMTRHGEAWQGKARRHMLVCEVDLYPIKHVQGNG